MTLTASPPLIGSDLGRRRILLALWAASMLGGLAQSLTGPAGTLLAQRVDGSESVAGLPQTLLVVGAAASGLGLSRLTLRRGRGVALCTGSTVAVTGCGVVLVAAISANLPLILLGSLLLGAGNTAVMLGRYAAADLGPETARARAMASVLLATTVGAVAGPNLLAPTCALATAVGLPALAGPYVVAAAFFGAAAAVMGRQPARLGHERGPATGTARVRLDRPAVTGLVVLTVANLVMVAVMTMAPIQLSKVGSGLAGIGLVVSLHIAGMFGPSPISGWLTGRIGQVPAAAIAGVLLVSASGLAAIGAASGLVMTLAMVLLGIGWNLGLISGSGLLTATAAAPDRPRREGIGEAAMGVAAAIGGASAGPLMAGAGYSFLAAMGAIAASFIVLTVRWTAG
jgi:MFS family permease